MFDGVIYHLLLNQIDVSCSMHVERCMHKTKTFIVDNQILKFSKRGAHLVQYSRRITFHDQAQDFHLNDSNFEILLRPQDSC